MVQSIDKDRVMGTIKHEKSVVDFFTGAGTGIIVSCLFSPNSSLRTTVIIVGIIMVCIGWYKKSKSDKKVFLFIKELDLMNFRQELPVVEGILAIDGDSFMERESLLLIILQDFHEP